MRNAKKPRKKAKNKKGKKALKITFITVLIIILTIGVSALGIGFAMIKTAPPLDINKILSLNEPTRFYDANGNLVDEYKTVERRDLASKEEIPKYLSDAFISIEDERFMTHDGIDLYRFLGAMKHNVKAIFGKAEGVQGASTITQQLIKQRLFLESSLTDRLNIQRKVQEMYLAIQLEKELEKEDIITAYMNTIPLGSHAYGVKAAADMYFSKDLSELTLLECAFIASAAQNPSLSYSNAYEGFKENKTFASERTLAVLRKMLETGAITQTEFDEATTDRVVLYIADNGEANPIKDKVVVNFNFKTGNLNKMSYEWFSRAVIEQLYKDLKKQNKTEEEISDLLTNGGLKIYTTMDTKLQNTTQAILNDYKTEDKTGPYDFLFPVGSNLEPVQDLQAGIVVMDYHNGHVKTIVGGRGEQGPMSFNRAASDSFLRPPGSSIKPLTVYAPAIDTKVLTAGSIIEDSPVNEAFKTKYNVTQEVYPKNAPLRYRGYLTLREGIRHSANTVAVKVVDKLGVEVSASYAENFGIHINQSDMGPAALGLGQLTSETTGENLSGANPLSLANAYGAFGNNGLVCEPILYTKVTDKDGNVLIEPKYEVKPVISPQSAYIMYDMLKEPVSSGGTGTAANFGNMPVRGKTGTSGDGRDLTFAGLTPYYSAAIWVGNDDNSKIQSGANGYFGSNSVARIWSRIMEVAHEGLEPIDIAKPDGIVNKKISKDSGTLPSELTYKDPRGNRVYTEMFIEGTVPTTYDNVHVLAEVVQRDDGSFVLPGEFTPPGKIQKRVFITRDYIPSVKLEDQIYVLPTAVDDSKEIIEEPKDEETEIPDITDPEEEKDPSNPDGNVNGGSDNDNPDGSNKGSNSESNNSGASTGPSGFGEAKNKKNFMGNLKGNIIKSSSGGSGGTN